MFGVRADEYGWIACDEIVPLAGGGVAAIEATRAAVASLEQRGMLEVTDVRGTTLYRRTPAASELALAILESESIQLLSDAAKQEGNGVWRPEPGTPLSLDEVIGQQAAVHLVRTNVTWAARTSSPPANMLLYGRSGLGKSMMAGIVSREWGARFVALSAAEATGEELHNALDVASAGSPALLFLDELQAASRGVRDRLLVALDPALPRTFATIGATTDPGSLSLPLRRRFQLEIPLEDYGPQDAALIVCRRAEALDLRFEDGVADIIARASRGNPGHITRYLVEARMLVEGLDRMLTREEFIAHLQRTSRDERGIDRVAVEMMLFLRDECDGRPAGMTKFADVLGLDLQLIRERLADLRREGLVRSRGRAGHALSAAGRAYLQSRLTV